MVGFLEIFNLQYYRITMSKKKDDGPPGYLGELSAEQDEAFQQIKEWMVQKNYDENPWLTDTFWLRFCRARKFDVDKVKEMIDKYMGFREEYNVDTIMSYKFERK